MESTGAQKALETAEHLRSEADEAARKTTEEAREGLGAVREDAGQALDKARAGLAGLSRGAKARAQKVANAADEYAHENPWPMLTAALATGFLVGYLLTHRSRM